MIYNIENTPYSIEVLLDDPTDVCLYRGKIQAARFHSLDEVNEFLRDQMAHCDRCQKDKHWSEMITAHVCSECWADEVDEVYERLRG